MTNESANQAVNQAAETTLEDVLDGNTWVEHNLAIMITGSDVQILDTDDSEAVIIPHELVARIHRRIKAMNRPDTKTGVMF